MGTFSGIRRIGDTLVTARAWRPATLAALSGSVMHRARNVELGLTDRDHLEGAAGWLARAQDAQRDGGVSGRYHLGRGWSSSYPETTGYLVPTMLALESEARLTGFHERARRCIEFLLGIQLEGGGFPGMEIAQNRDTPSIFNSAQILNGLTAWHRATGDETVLQAATRAADWLTAEQDADGAWRRHLYGSGRTYTYMAHAGCWVAEFGAHTGERRYLDAARRHLQWVLSHVDDSTGWIDDCGFDDGSGERAAVTHTIAYTIWGVLMMSNILGDERGMGVARRAARAVARRLGLAKWLPGRLDARWRPAATYACLTGNAQMALIWLELHRVEGDPALVDAALRAIDLVKGAQMMRSSDPGLRGGVAGSDPMWGKYIELAVPNWAVKFFLDALLVKARTLGAMAPLPCRAAGAPREVPAGVPRSLPAAAPAAASVRRPRVVLLADERSRKVAQFAASWASWGFVPDAVIIRTAPDESRRERLAAFVRERGLGGLVRRAVGGNTRAHAAAAPTTHASRATAPAAPPEQVAAYCARRGIPIVRYTSLDNSADVAALRALDADLFVTAGFGIVRRAMLALPRLGTLNVHMGLLPPMRGMNVAEWSAFTGVPVGCTVHVVDPGVDTGDIIMFREVDATGATDIQALRDRVDDAQVVALGDVVRWVLEHGALPPACAQAPEDGRQYFAMHDDLRALLDAHLRTLTPATAPAR
ncbi:MAG TPA: formyltransferase family protein [Gemmatimonadaceae bacterium]